MESIGGIDKRLLAIKERIKHDFVSLLFCATFRELKDDPLLGVLQQEIGDSDCASLYNDVINSKTFDEVSTQYNDFTQIAEELRQQEINEDSAPEIWERLKTKLKEDNCFMFSNGEIHSIRTEADRKRAKQIIDEISLEDDDETDIFEPDPANPLPEQEMLLSYDDIAFIPKEEISAIKAKAKSGKTHLGIILTAALISAKGECCGIKRTRKDPYKVLFIDTEQSERTAEKLYIKALKLADLPTNERFALFKMENLRKKKKSKRSIYLKKWAKDGYDIIILDGIKDLTKDFNDLKEADGLLEDLTDLVSEYHLNLCAVLHENPGKDTDKMRGHLGTELCNKAFEVLQVCKDEDADVYNVKTTERREKDIPTFAFRFNDDGMLEQCDPTTKIKISKTTNKEETHAFDNCWTFWKEVAEGIDKEWTLQELALKYVEKYNEQACTGRRLQIKEGRCQTAEQHIRSALGRYLRKDESSQKGKISLMPRPDEDNC